jgi:hypothetical protein
LAVPEQCRSKEISKRSILRAAVNFDMSRLFDCKANPKAMTDSGALVKRSSNGGGNSIWVPIIMFLGLGVAPIILFLLVPIWGPFYLLHKLIKHISGDNNKTN